MAGRWARKEEHCTCLMLSKPATRMKQSGKAEVHADLREDLLGVGAAVPRGASLHPVAVVVVARVDGGVEAGPAVGVSVRLVGGLELDAGSPAVVEEVLDLAGDLLVGEGGEEGESLEEPEGRGSEEVEVSG